MPAAVQAAATSLMQRSAFLTASSLTTVAAMLAVVTHTGVRSTDGTSVPASESLVEPLVRAAGGVSPARR